MYIARRALPRFVPRVLNPIGLVGLPLNANDYSISIPSVKLPSHLISEYRSSIDELCSAQLSSDIPRFCTVLSKFLTTLPINIVLPDVVKLLTPDLISRLSITAVVEIMQKLGAIEGSHEKADLFLVCTLLCDRLSTFSEVPIPTLLSFLTGLSECGYKTDSDNLMSVQRVIKRVKAESLDFAQLSEFLYLVSSIDISWYELGVRDGVRAAWKNGFDTASLEHVGQFLRALNRMKYKLSVDKDSTLVSIAHRGLELALTSDHAEHLKSASPFVCDIFRGLGGLDLRFDHCSPQLQQLILKATSTYLPILEPSEQATVLWSLGTMLIEWQDLNQPTRKLLLGSFSDVLDKSAVPIASMLDALKGIVMLGATKNDFSADLQDKFQTCVTAAMKQMIPHQILVCMNCLSSLGAEWKYLNRSCQDSIVAGMMEYSKNANDGRMAIIVVRLHNLGVSYSQLPIGLQNVMDASLTACLSKMNTTNFVNTIYRLAKMQLFWQNCSTHLNLAILNSLSSHLAVTESPRLVYALNLMKLKWTNLQSPLQTAMMDAIHRCLLNVAREKSPETQLSWIVQSISEMRIDWHSIPEATRVALFSAIESCRGLHNSPLSTVLLGLAHMQLKWTRKVESSLPASTTESLLDCLKSPTAFNQNIEYHVITSMWALALMNCDWKSLGGVSKALLKPLLSGGCSGGSNGALATEAVSRILYSLGRMGATWADLSDEMQARVKESVVNQQDMFNISHLARTMHGLAMMTFDSPCHTNRDLTLWTMHYTLLKALRKLLAEDSLSVSEQEQLKIYAEVLRTAPIGAELVNRVVPNLSRVLPASEQVRQHQKFKNLSDGSFHKGVAMNTRYQLHDFSRQFKLLHEFSGFESGVFPVDTAVYCGDKLVALVEIDGEQHYTASGELIRSDQLKEFLYSIKFPEVPLYRIKNSHISEKGFRKTGSALTMAILMALEDTKAK